MDRGNRFAVPLKERRNVMLQKFFENIFDVELYCQMVDLILRFQKIRTENRHIENFRTMLYFSAVLNRAWKRDTVCIIRERFWNVWKKKWRSRWNNYAHLVLRLQKPGNFKMPVCLLESRRLHFGKSSDEFLQKTIFI
mgnify:CR=1 FL=1